MRQSFSLPTLELSRSIHLTMKTSIVAAAAITAFTQTAAAAVEAKNVIYVIPDGWGPASQTLSRDLHWLVETGTNSSNPEIGTLAADNMVCAL